MIEIVTFTGVDDRTDFDELRYVVDKYPFVEFGVLVGSETGQGNPIFPGLYLVRRLQQTLPSDRIAVHFCGKYARAVMGRTWEERQPRIYDVSEGYGRVQVNLHGDVGNPDPVAVDTSGLESFANHSTSNWVILQHRAGWQDIPLFHPKVEYLFDLSEGRGEEGFAHWPDPPDDRRVGYAGGIGPHNIDRAIDFANKHPDRSVWFDMERNVRTPDYWFDMDRVRAVCSAVADAQG